MSSEENLLVRFRILASWLNTNWMYRKQHLLKGTSVGAQTDYQVGIKVYYGAGADGTEAVGGTTFGKIYCDSKCKSDFGDIRFTAADGITELEYFIQKKTDSSNALIWVKVPSIPASPAYAAIFIYYGNSFVSTTEDGDATFEFFDDFENETDGDPPSNWDVTEETANGVRVSNALAHRGSQSLRLYSTNGQRDYATKLLTTPLHTNWALYYAFYPHLYNVNGHGSGISQFDSEGTQAVWMGLHDEDLKYYADAAYQKIDDAPSGSWYEVEVHSKTGTNTIDVWFDGTQQTNEGNFRNDVNDLMLLQTAGWTAQPAWRTYLDIVFIRKFANPDPTHSTWGSEESISANLLAKFTVAPHSQDLFSRFEVLQNYGDLYSRLVVARYLKNWLKDSDNPIVDPGDDRVWPAIEWDAGKFHLYLGHYSAASDIKYYTSKDGENFTEHTSSPVITRAQVKSAWGLTTNVDALEAHSIIWWNSKWRMYFGAQYNADAKWRIGYADSEDFVSWSISTSPCIVPTQYWETSNTPDPHAVVINGIIYLFYAGSQLAGGWATGLAISTDGHEFVKSINNPIQADGVPISFKAIGNGATGLMMDRSVAHYPYDARFTHDGETLAAYSGNPVLTRDAGNAWEATSLGHGDICKVGSDYWVYYVAQDAGANFRLGRAGNEVGSNDLFAKFEVGKDSEDLFGKIEVRHSTSVEILAKFFARPLSIGNYENPYDYTEVDIPSNRLRPADAKQINIVQLDRDETCYFYQDKGAGASGTVYEFKVAIRVSAGPGRVSFVVWGDTLGDLTDCANATALRIEEAAVNDRLTLVKKELNVYTTQNYDYVVGTWYYCWFTRVGAALKCRIYSDAAYQNLLQELNLTMDNGATTYRYLSFVSSEDTGAVGQTLDAYVKDWLIYTNQTSDLLSKFEVKQTGSEDLFGRILLTKSSFNELSCKGEIRHPDSVELLGKGIIRNLNSADLSAKVKISQPGSAELLGKTDIQQSGSAELLGKTDIQHSDSAELLSRFSITYQTSVDLFSRFEAGQDSTDLLGKINVQTLGSADLSAKFDVGQDSVDFLGKGVVRHTGTPVELKALANITHSVNLLCKFDARNVSSADLLARFEVGQGFQDLFAKDIIRGRGAEELKALINITHSVELLGKFVVRHPPRFPLELLAKFSVGLTNASEELLSRLKVQKVATLDLLGNFIIGHAASSELLSKIFVNQLDSVELLSKFKVKFDSSAELLCNFDLQRYLDLHAKFIVGPPVSSLVYLVCNNVSSWINVVMGVGDGFISMPWVEADTEIKICGNESAKLTSTYTPGQYKEIRFGWDGKCAGGMNLRREIPSTGLENLFAQSIIRNSNTVDLAARIDVKSLIGFDLYGRFEVGQDFKDLGALFKIVEADYSSWTLVWSRDYGASPDIDRLVVDNQGRVYAWDSGSSNAYVKDYAGAEVNTPLYTYWFIVKDKSVSDTEKYVLGVPDGTPTQFDVWKYGAIIFGRDSVLDEVDANSVQWVAISPNGKFIAIIVDSIATGNLRHILLYEGS